MNPIKILVKKSRILYVVLLGVYKLILKPARRISDLKWKERKIRNRTERNKEKTFYIIRRRSSDVGLFSYFMTVLGHIAYAEKMGFVPVVDMKNYNNMYLTAEEVGHKNAWEYYFLQPGGTSLEEALSSRHVILSSDSIPHYDADSRLFLNSDGILDSWRRICRKYIVFNKQVETNLEKECKKMIYLTGGGGRYWVSAVGALIIRH